MTRTVAQTMAALLWQMERAPDGDAQDRLEALIKERLPSGSGVDSGTSIEWAESSSEKLTLACGFHHMNEGGFYDGWTHHKVIVRASLMGGLDIRVTGRDKRQIKSYLADLYAEALDSPI